MRKEAISCDHKAKFLPSCFLVLTFCSHWVRPERPTIKANRKTIMKSITPGFENLAFIGNDTG